MDPSTVLLIGSHVATLVAGVLFGRWLVVRNLEVGEHDGHVTFEVKHHCPPDDD
jgi:hypothetical protein